ncbi:hypothetical protein BpHYR1_036452, partial [Brachionus plicatilis]
NYTSQIKKKTFPFYCKDATLLQHIPNVVLHKILLYLIIAIIRITLDSKLKFSPIIFFSHNYFLAYIVSLYSNRSGKAGN